MLVSIYKVRVQEEEEEEKAIYVIRNWSQLLDERSCKSNHASKLSQEEGRMFLSFFFFFFYVDAV